MTVKAYVLGKINPTKEGDIKEKLRSLVCVSEVDLCFGKYDFIITCEAEDIPALEAGAIERIRERDDITATETLIVNTLELKAEPVEEKQADSNLP